jgi:hypothetical protein
MSVETISKMLSMKSQMNNLRLQQMNIMERSIGQMQAIEQMNEDQRTAPAKKALDDLLRTRNILDTVNKVNFDSLSADDRVAIQEAKKYHTQKMASRFIHFDDNVSAALSPASSENGAKAQSYTIEHNVGLLAADGVSADQQEYHREMAASNAILASGGDPIGMQYDQVPAIALDMVREAVPGFEPAEVALVPEDYQVRFNTFKATALNYFKKEFENDPSLSTQDRMVSAARMAMADMNIAPQADPEMANAFLKGGIESIMEYRESEGLLNMQRLEGLNATNIIAARDGLNKLGFDIANLSPTDMINTMQKNIGFRNMIDIAEAVSVQGDDTMLLSSLSAYVDSINPNIMNPSISEVERKNLVKKNFLDVLAKRVEYANIPPVQKVAMISMIDRIDKQVDSNEADPMINKMLEHVYSRWSEGFMVHDAEQSQFVQGAQQSGNGIIRETTTGKLIKTQDNFDEYVQRSGGNPQLTAITSYYRDSVNSAPNGAGWSFVKSAYQGTDGTVDFNVRNKQFLFGSPGDNNVQIGLSPLMNAIITDAPLSSIEGSAFSTEMGKEVADKLLETVALAANINNGQDVSGIFEEWTDKNPLKKAGAVLETYKDRDGKLYVVPPEIAKKFEKGFDFQRLKDAALKSEHGVKAIYGTLMHAYQVDAQAAADVYLQTLSSGVDAVYPGTGINQDGSQEPVYKTAMKQEMDSFENELPYLISNKNIPDDLDYGQRDQITKYREALETRRARVEQTLKMANENSSDLQRGAFEGTYASGVAEDLQATVNTLTELSKTLQDIETMPIQRFGYDLTGTIKRYDMRALNTRNKLYNRLMVAIGDMKKASR